MRRRPSLRKLLLGLAAAIALLVVAAFLAPLFVSSDFVKHEIARFVTARTARECRIDGQLRFSLLPRLEVTADDVSLANAEGGVAPHLIEVNRVEASFRLLPLLRGRLVADRVELVQPVLHAEIDKNGRPNWLFRTPTKVEPAAAPSAPGPNISSTLAQLRIVSGILNYLDQRGVKSLTVPNISLDASLLKKDGSADAVGAAAWNGDMVKFTARAASFSALWDGGSDVAFSVTSGWANLDFKGKASLADKGAASGPVSFKSPSLQEMLKWAGFPGASREFPYQSPVSLDGKIELTPKTLSLTDATLLGPMTATGGFFFERGTNRPIVKANLYVTTLDLDPYVEAAFSPPGPAATANPATASALPQASAPEPTPIFVPHLGKVELNLIMTVDAIRYRGLSIGKSFLTAALNQPSGRSLISIGEMALYGGQVGGDLFIDVKPAGPPSLSGKLNMTKVDAGPLLRALSGGEVLTGRGDLTADLQATGDNESELIASLSGSGHIALANGNLTGAVVQPGDIVLPQLRNNGTSPSAQLPYDSISADFAISQGVLTTENLKLSSPKISATGNGSIELSLCQVDWHWLPVIPGRGSAQIAVIGPCDAPSYRAMTVTITPNGKK